jgi:hypothetical protein
MTPHTDPAPTYRPCPLSRADFARRTGRARSTVTEACRGPLAPACDRDRIDAIHPAAAEWARQRGIDPSVLLCDFYDATLLYESIRSLTADRPEGSYYLVTVQFFAYLAGVRSSEVAEVLSQVVRGCIIDVADPRALEFMAAHPYPRGRDGLVHELPLGTLWGATVVRHVGDDDPSLDPHHPLMRVFMARCDGKVPQGPWPFGHEDPEGQD